MDYLDWDLAVYQDYEGRTCDICGEYNDDDWRCDCCHDCSKTHAACECGSEEDDEIITRQINLQQ
jgi:hypothetical protein